MRSFSPCWSRVILQVCRIKVNKASVNASDNGFDKFSEEAKDGERKDEKKDLDRRSSGEHRRHYYPSKH